LYAGELNVQQLVSHEKMITQGARLGIARSTTLLESISSAGTTIKTKHNNLNVGDRLWFESDGRFEFMAVTGGPTRINRCQANCDADNGTTYWATTTTALTFQREQRWQGEGAIEVAAVAVGDAYQTHPENFLPSTAYTISLYIRRADAGVITPGPTAYVLFCGSFTGVQATAISVGAGWYRLYANCTSPPSLNQAFGVTWLPNVVHYIDALQIEPGSTLTDWSESASQYTVSRNLDGSGATPWEAGAGILDTGSIGTAWIDAYAESSIRGKFNYGSKVLEMNPAGYWRFGTHGFADSSINSTAWTMNGSAIGANSGVGGATSDGQGGAYQISSGYLTIPDATRYRITGDLTIELFLHWPSDTTGYIVSKGVAGRGEFDIHWIAGSGGHIRYAHGNGSSNTSIVEACANGSIPLNTYTHVAIVRDTTNQQILCYINGALNQRTSYTTTPTATADALAAFARSDAAYSEPAGKHMDDLALYPRMLSADEIKEHYDARLRSQPETQYGPTMVGNVRYGTSWNDWRPFWAIGNLSGTYDYTQHTYGFVAGDPTQTWVSVDAAKGFRIMSGATEKLRADTAGNLTLTGNLTIGNTGFIKSGGKNSCTSGDGIWIAYNGTVGQACIGTQTGNRLNWDGTNLLLKSNRLQIDQNGIQIAPTTTGNYDSPSSVSFGPLPMGGSNYIQSFESGAVRTLDVQNQTASGFASHVTLSASSVGHTLDANSRLDVRGGTSANDGFVHLVVGVSGGVSQVVGLYGFGSNGIFGPWGVASPGVVDLGRQGAKWGDIWHTPVQTGAVLWPLVDNAGRIEAKTDGSNAALACPAGQAIKNLTVEFGIVVGVSCGPI
jgi:hypothetical protein